MRTIQSRWAGRGAAVGPQSGPDRARKRKAPFSILELLHLGSPVRAEKDIKALGSGLRLSLWRCDFRNAASPWQAGCLGSFAP